MIIQLTVTVNSVHSVVAYVDQREGCEQLLSRSWCTIGIQIEAKSHLCTIE